jgi:hypothetical protein
MGDIGTSRLYGQYQDYQSFGLDVGFRIYAKGEDASLRPYAEATAGIAFIDETDVTLVAPSIGFTGTATDFYDRTAAFTLGGNAGVTWQVADQVEVFGQLGTAVGIGDVSGRRTRRNWARDDQRQQREVDGAVCSGGAGPILSAMTIES